MVSENDAQSTQTPYGVQIQVREIRDSDQNPDDPLQESGNANVSQPDATAEHYVPWLGDISTPGIIPRVQGALFAFGAMAVSHCVVYIGFISAAAFITGLSLEVWGMSVFDIMSTTVYFITGYVNWIPAICVFCYLHYNPNSSKMKRGIVIVVGVTVFGLLLWVHYAGHMDFPYNGSFFLWNESDITAHQDSLWNPPAGSIFFLKNASDIRAGFIPLKALFTGTVSQSFRGCNTRVEPQQSSLFLPDIYNTQFARFVYENSTRKLKFLPAFNFELSHSIQMNQTLCGQGFIGIADLYGLGIRTSLYLQWISALLANNLLPDTRQQLQKIYLIFSLAICLATIIASFAKTCIFSIEIEIIY